MTITLKQAGALGGAKRWKGKTKKERSDAMREVALARHRKNAADKQLSSNRVSSV